MSSPTPEVPSPDDPTAGVFDFLGLLETDFDGTRLIVVHGRSGTGKSTSLRLLFESHPRFAEQRFHVVRPAFGDPLPPSDGQPVVVDEVLTVRDLPLVVRLLRRGHVVGVASHLPPFVYAPLRVAWRTRTFFSGRDAGKLAWELRRLGVSHTEADLERFRRRFGANFVELRIVLERSPGRSLDRALAFFDRHCTLKTKRATVNPAESNAAKTPESARM